MTTWQLLTTGWSGEPSVLIGCTLLIGGYVAVTRRRPSRAIVAFAAGLAVLLVAQLSPLDLLGDTYLFSAHMVQHLLLVLIVPPLLILGLPSWLVKSWLRTPLVCRSERIVRQPVLAWLLGIGAVYLWHLPSLYNATLAHEPIHITEHLCFLITGVIFWWPVLAPHDASRATPLAAALYLFAAALAMSLLGIIFTFTAPGLYPAYVHPTDTRGVLSLVRDAWGLSPAADQQLGGLMMWVPGGLIYLGAMLATLVRWYAAADEDEKRPTAPAFRLPTMMPSSPSPSDPLHEGGMTQSNIEAAG